VPKVVQIASGTVKTWTVKHISLVLSHPVHTTGVIYAARLVQGAKVSVQRGGSFIKVGASEPVSRRSADEELATVGPDIDTRSPSQ